MRHILHVDMDAFYAAVEQLDQPELEGRPVIVGADPKAGAGRGVVAACSYEARKLGIHSALPISHAWRRCPNGVYLRPRMDRYKEMSVAIMGILRRYTDLVEPISIDEAFLDVSGSTALMGPAEGIARNLKSTIKQETGLTASVGMAPNKFLAKIASDLDKPDGFVVVREGEVESFLANLPVSRLWGVGPKTATRLEKLGIHTIGEIAAIPLQKMVEALGASGEHLWRLAHGEDERRVVSESEPKSISNETTFERDTSDNDLLLKTLRQLSDKVAGRLRRQGFKTRTISLKLRYQSFTTFTRQTSVPEGLDTGNEIFALIRTLFEKLPLEESVRLIGVGTSNLLRASKEEEQLSLFETSGQSERLAEALDEIHNRYGDSSLRRGSDLS
jgi:DNA polymerase-4